jgi:shikimate kinase
MKTSIALIGFMGTGKTVVGKLLAAKLGKEFIELDALIEKRAAKSIPAIFRDEGEIAFRELEIDVAREVAGRKNVVIACGGGIVLNKINIDRLAPECVIVCLSASPAVILKRTSGGKDDRPLLAVDDRARQIKDLMAFRRPYYQRSADITVNTSRLRPGAVVRKIVAKVRDHESIG